MSLDSATRARLTSRGLRLLLKVLAPALSSTRATATEAKPAKPAKPSSQDQRRSLKNKRDVTDKLRNRQVKNGLRFCFLIFSYHSR